MVLPMAFSLEEGRIIHQRKYLSLTSLGYMAVMSKLSPAQLKTSLNGRFRVPIPSFAAQNFQRQVSDCTSRSRQYLNASYSAKALVRLGALLGPL